MNLNPCKVCGSDHVVIMRPMIKTAGKWIALYNPTCSECNNHLPHGKAELDEAVNAWNEDE